MPKKAQAKKPKRRWLRRIAAGVGLFVVGTGGVAGWIVYREISANLPPVDKLLRYQLPVATRVYAADGTLLGEFYTEKRYLVPIAKIPAVVRQAFIAAEDSELLPAPGRRRARHRTRRHRQLHGRLGRPGRQHHHPAGREVAAAHPGEELRAQDEGDPAVAPPRAPAHQGRDPLPLPEPDLPRERRVRRRRGRPGVLRQGRRRPRPRRGGAARRPAAGAEPLLAGPPLGPRQVPPALRARAHGARALRHLGSERAGPEAGDRAHPPRRERADLRRGALLRRARAPPARGALRRHRALPGRAERLHHRRSRRRRRPPRRRCARTSTRSTWAGRAPARSAGSAHAEAERFLASRARPPATPTSPRPAAPTRRSCSRSTRAACASR